MKNITLLAVAMAVGLVAAPAFAVDAGLDQFTALSSVASDVTPLSDEQLATVEGGTHINAVLAVLDLAADLQSNFYGTLPQNLVAAQAVQNAAIAILQAVDAHSCVGFAGC